MLLRLAAYWSFRTGGPRVSPGRRLVLLLVAMCTYLMLIPMTMATISKLSSSAMGSTVTEIDGYKEGDVYRDGWVIEKIFIGQDRDGTQGYVPWDYMPILALRKGVDHTQIVSSHSRTDGWDTFEESRNKDYSYRCKTGETIKVASYWTEGYQVHGIKNGKVTSRPFGASRPGEKIVCRSVYLAKIKLVKNGQRLIRSFWIGKRFARCDNDFPCIVVVDEYEEIVVKRPPPPTPKTPNVDIDVNLNLNVTIVNVQYVYNIVIKEEFKEVPEEEKRLNWTLRSDAAGSTVTESSFGGYQVFQQASNYPCFIPPPGTSIPPGTVLPPNIPSPPGVGSGPNNPSSPPRWYIDPSGNVTRPKWNGGFQKDSLALLLKTQTGIVINSRFIA